MIIPSIDIQNGQAVQLINGEKLAIEAGDPVPLAEKFGRTGPIAVIDLDAAMGRGSNEAQIRALCQKTRCRVGGGIRDLQTALNWLNAGAEQIIIGTAATRELLAELPRERVIVALDARNDEVVVNGWTQGTGRSVESRMEELRDLVSGFLVTFVEKEGMMQGTRLDRVAALQAAAGSCRLTIAGGVTTTEDIRLLDDRGVDAQVGMALYTGRINLAEGFSAPLRTDRETGSGPPLWWMSTIEPWASVTPTSAPSAKRSNRDKGCTGRALEASGERANPVEQPRSCSPSAWTATATRCGSRSASTARAFVTSTPAAALAS